MVTDTRDVAYCAEGGNVVLSVVDVTKKWLEECIIGENLCPFAKVPYQENRIRVSVKDNIKVVEIKNDVISECTRLLETHREELETSLLVFPNANADLHDWNEIVNFIQICIEDSELHGQVQVVMFHPKFQFGDADPDDITNVVNRSPYPTIHILREESISEVIDRGADTTSITKRNSDYLRTMGWDGWNTLMRKVMNSH